jgi:UTP-glucose-1-phosphate uridylyltransferase
MADTRFLIVPAAGLGTRMKVVAPDLSKELLPVGPKPAIEYTMVEGMDAGVEAIIVILSRAKEDLHEYLASLDYPITFLYQDQLTGEADAIALAEPVVGDDSLAIIYPDNVYLPSSGALKLLFGAYERHGTDLLALTRVTTDTEATFSNAGRVNLAPLEEGLYRIQRFAKKAPGHFQRRFPVELRACGMMICGVHVFDAIRRMRPTVTCGEFTDEPVRRFMLEEWGMLGLCLPGAVFDIGNPQGYRNCLQVLKGN